jgi:hypothetical protein
VPTFARKRVKINITTTIIIIIIIIIIVPRYLSATLLLRRVTAGPVMRAAGSRGCELSALPAELSRETSPVAISFLSRIGTVELSGERVTSYRTDTSKPPTQLCYPASRPVVTRLIAVASSGRPTHSSCYTCTCLHVPIFLPTLRDRCRLKLVLAFCSNNCQHIEISVFTGPKDED